LNLLRVQAQRTYSSTELAAAIDDALKTPTTSTVPQAGRTDGSPPLCPNWRVQMVLRPAVKGRYEAFYGCTNYPRCRERKLGPSA
jgi:ssDNA-binding Zn-finger/Zn-ribbon topoisomerase 1